MKIKLLIAVVASLISASAVSASYGVNNYSTSNANAYQKSLAADKAKLDMIQASLSRNVAYYNQNCSFGQKSNMCNYLRDGGLRDSAASIRSQAAFMSTHYNQPTSTYAQYNSVHATSTLTLHRVPGYGNTQTNLYSTTYAVR